MSESPFHSAPSTTGGPSQDDVIEFRCSSCGSLLRVPGGAVGRKVKCPRCETINEIAAQPSGADAPASDGNPSAAPASTTGAQSPSPSFRGPSSAPPVTARPSPNLAEPMYPGPTAIPTGPSAREPGRSEQELAPTSEQMLPVKTLFDRIIQEVSKIYVGQDELVLGTLVALFSSGHVLIESVPGLGKTLFVRTLGKILGCRFGRIQFTADLMPSDITGAPVYNMKTQEFDFRPGPVFTQLLLADEINRSPAKTHAALLEIMQEYRVTVDGVSHRIERPFLVMATQNPIESEGTYNLPEAQLDRFMFKIVANYPTETEEADILRMHSKQVDVQQRIDQELETVTEPHQIMETTQLCGEVRVDDKLIDYVNRIARLTREWPYFHLGSSPRGGLALVQGARTLAAFYGRDYAVPDDVVQIALPALRHRVILTAEAEVEGHRVDTLLGDLIRSVEVPRL